MWLLIGGDSEIGAAMHRYLANRGQPVRATTRRVQLVSSERPLLDLSDRLADWEPPAGTEAACIFAAIGRLVTCADDPAGSARVNVTGTVAVAERLLARGIYVLFLSTNQVFDGSRSCMPARAPMSAVSEYGKQKARTEAAMRAHMRRGAPAGILRLSKVLSPRGTLVHQWTAALSAGKPVKAFRDMRFAPVPVDLVCETITMLLRSRSPDIFQLSGPRDVSYAEAAAYLAARTAADPALVEGVAAASARLPEGATPLHTTLDSSLLRDRYGISVPDAWDVIENLLFGQERIAKLSTEQTS